MRSYDTQKTSKSIKNEPHYSIYNGRIGSFVERQSFVDSNPQHYVCVATRFERWALFLGEKNCVKSVGFWSRVCRKSYAKSLGRHRRLFGRGSASSGLIPKGTSDVSIPKFCLIQMPRPMLQKIIDTNLIPDSYLMSY